MKRAGKLTALALAIVGTVLISGCLAYRDKPIKWIDEQGGVIVKAIENEFTVPIDPMSGREGIYHSGWAYRRGGVWNQGSEITIYGVKNPDAQNRIIGRIKELVFERQYCDVIVTFFDDAKYKREGGIWSRIDVPELRSERIVGKESSRRISTNTQ